VAVGSGRRGFRGRAVAVGERVVVYKAAEEVAGVRVDADVWQLFNGRGAIRIGVTCVMSMMWD
jgi:hypothetical protein